MGKPKTAAQKKAEKAAADAKKKAKAPRKPTLKTEDYGVLKYALEALINAEELREVNFAESHIRCDDGENFTGTYAELVDLYQSFGKPTGTVMRTKAMALLERIAPHASK